MGKLYQQVGQYLYGMFDGEVIVEIGSDRWEGSSAYFADLANTHGMRLITVDLDAEAGVRLRRTIAPQHVPGVEFVQADGVTWSKQYSGPTIRALYLDNFDWDWNTNRPSDMIQQQQQWYSAQGLVMNNLNSQAVHLAQMMNLMPHMSKSGEICVDDTYEYNGVYIGKGGAVVPYLMSQGFHMLAARDYGVILGCGYHGNVVQYSI